MKRVPKMLFESLITEYGPGGGVEDIRMPHACETVFTVRKPDEEIPVAVGYRENGKNATLAIWRRYRSGIPFYQRHTPDVQIHSGKLPAVGDEREGIDIRVEIRGRVISMRGSEARATMKIISRVYEIEDMLRGK